MEKTKIKQVPTVLDQVDKELSDLSEARESKRWNRKVRLISWDNEVLEVSDTEFRFYLTLATHYGWEIPEDCIYLEEVKGFDYVFRSVRFRKDWTPHTHDTFEGKGIEVSDESAHGFLLALMKAESRVVIYEKGKSAMDLLLDLEEITNFVLFALMDHRLSTDDVVCFMEGRRMLLEPTFADDFRKFARFVEKGGFSVFEIC